MLPYKSVFAVVLLAVLRGRDTESDFNENSRTECPVSQRLIRDKQKEESEIILIFP